MRPKLKILIVLLPLLAASCCLPAANYYWVGGSGSWSQLTHWATTSGGNVYHTQIPTGNDDVFFDANSFAAPGQVVTVNLDNITCRNFNWQGAGFNPAFEGPASSSLGVFGAFTLIPGMQFNFSGDLHFQSNLPAQNLSFAGKTINGNVLFEGAGAWVMQDALMCTGILRIQSGTLNTNNQNITAAQMVWASSAGPVFLQLGSSIITLNGAPYPAAGGNGQTPVFDIIANGLNITPGSARIELSHSQANLNISGSGGLLLPDIYFTNTTANQVELSTLGHSGTSIFNNLGFASHARVSGSFTVNTLFLSPGKDYAFRSGSALIVNNISAIGSCQQPISLQTFNGVGQMTFKKNTGAITLDFVSLKDIRATGGATFTANNAVDLGNNSGWTLNLRSVQTLFWVGDSGNWDDPQHWALSSGGPGGACIPSGADHVVFDQNSFSNGAQIVTINPENAYCRDMRWQNIPNGVTLAGGGDRKLHIFGSLLFAPELNQQFLGDVWFEARTSGQSITSAGKRFRQNLIFDGPGGEWILQDSLSVRFEIHHFQGLLRSNDEDIFAEKYFAHEVTSPRGLILGNSTFTLRTGGAGAAPEWFVSGVNFDFQKGTSTIHIGGPPGLPNVRFYTFGQALDYHKVIVEGQVFMLQDADLYTHFDSCWLNWGGQVINNTAFDYLFLKAGEGYRFGIEDVFRIGYLDAKGACDAFVTIQSIEAGVAANFEGLQAQTDLNYLMVQDVHIQGAFPFIATNSVDQGNTNGWTLNAAAGRTLYWVLDSGNWLEPLHWSLSSGGPGGECPPGPADDVIFDENSFTAGGQVVSANFYHGYLNCHNLTWGNVGFMPRFDADNLKIYGSMDLSVLVNANLNNIEFMSKDSNSYIRSAGHAMLYARFQGSGKYRLLDDFKAYYLEFQNGILCTQGFTVITDYTVVFRGKWELSASIYHVNGETGGFVQLPLQFIRKPFMLDAGSSTFRLNAASQTGLYLPYPLVFSRIVATSPTALAYFESFDTTAQSLTAQYLQFFGDARFRLGINTDTLIFAAGKRYAMSVADLHSYRVKAFLSAIGNNCKHINIEALFTGGKADWIMPPTARIEADFVQMSDQNAGGGANFNAGSHSVNVAASNNGWIFGSAPTAGDIGVLGKDLSLCQGQQATFSAYSYSVNEQYFWSDGSSDTTLTVAQSGVYAVRVQFADNCEIVDTVVVALTDLAFELGPDTAFCQGLSVLIGPNPISGAAYTWSNGLQNAQIQADSAGLFYLEVSLLECRFEDSIQINVLPAPLVNLGPDRSECAGNAVGIGVQTQAGVTYLWSNGFSDPNIEVQSGGLYVLQASLNSCQAADSIQVAFSSLPQVALGPDQVICTGQTAFFSSVIESGTTYSWTDGTSGATRTAALAGWYVLQADNGVCQNQDSILLSVNPLPAVDLGPDRLGCTDSLFTIGVPAQANTQYSWSTGAITSLVQVSAPAEYILTATALGCSNSDTLEVALLPPPSVSLGLDLGLCPGETLTLQVADPGVVVTWSNGSNGNSLMVATPGTYWARAVNAFGCAGADTVLVAAHPLPPVFDLGPRRVICEGPDGEVLLSAPQAPNLTYFWSTGENSSSIIATVSGWYAVQVLTTNGCIRSDSVELEFRDKYSVYAGPDTSVCDNQPFITLRVQNPDADKYLWTGGGQGAETEVSTSGQYIVQAQKGECVGRDTVQVVFRHCSRFNAYLPNIFAPDKFDQNGTIRPFFPPEIEILEYQFEVYDRWGGLVFRSQDPAEAWDGRWRGKFCEMGVYAAYVKLRYRDDFGEGEAFLEGDITLYR